MTPAEPESSWELSLLRLIGIRSFVLKGCPENGLIGLLGGGGIEAFDASVVNWGSLRRKINIC